MKNIIKILMLSLGLVGILLGPELNCKFGMYDKYKRVNVSVQFIGSEGRLNTIRSYFENTQHIRCFEPIKEPYERDFNLAPDSLLQFIDNMSPGLQAGFDKVLSGLDNVSIITKIMPKTIWNRDNHYRFLLEDEVARSCTQKHEVTGPKTLGIFAEAKKLFDYYREQEYLLLACNNPYSDIRLRMLCWGDPETLKALQDYCDWQLLTTILPVSREFGNRQRLADFLQKLDPMFYAQDLCNKVSEFVYEESEFPELLIKANKLGNLLHRLDKILYLADFNACPITGLLSLQPEHSKRAYLIYLSINKELKGVKAAINKLYELDGYPSLIKK